MKRKVFINLPVADLEKSKHFYTSLGFSVNPMFSDETAACIVVSEEIYVMVLTHEKFRQFTPLPISDASKSTEVLVCLSCESRDEVDQMTDKALASGGLEPREPQDHGFMYGRSFADPDGHIWEPMWMDLAAAEQGGPEEVAAKA